MVQFKVDQNGDGVYDTIISQNSIGITPVYLTD